MGYAPVPLADYESFHTIKGARWMSGDYAADKYRVYFQDHIVEGVDSSEPDHYQGGEDWEKTSDFIVLNKDDEDNATLNPHSLETTHTWRAMRNVFPLMHASGVYEGHRAQDTFS